MRPIKKILIANRSEISKRIVDTCREMGIKTVAIYSEEEKDYPHRFYADEAYSLGSGALKDTYLNHEKIIDIALKAKACAIHPGYGFLSERSFFAKAVTDAGLIFIGPSVENIELMGDKKTSKEKILELNVPSIPGYHGKDQSLETLHAKAREIGYPVLIKASAGGGGKGMRIVNDDKDFPLELEGAKREALNAFSDDTVLIEKFIVSPRHIEIQVMSDAHGGHYHLFERECSIQRRYQKIIEESPSVALDAKLRSEMCEAALKITRGINYLGAGTVEFILDTDGKFYFLEMNTRLQVEHPVTEMVTGLDLVKMQIQVARGEKLNIHQNDIKQKGHAIEVRLYAEDPDNEFLPSTGKINYIGTPKVRNSRFDCGFVAGNEVTIQFDPMLAKLIVWAEDRALATTKMIRALDETPFLGVRTNHDYLKRIFKTEEYAKGLTYTHFVNTYKEKLKPEPTDKHLLMSAIALKAFTESQTEIKANQGAAWDKINGFRVL